MSTERQPPDEVDEVREWTLMFFFGTDNNLAPSVISQFKGMKDAGFRQDVNVLVRYDPNERGVPTRVFDVNRQRKKNRKGNRRREQNQVGDGADSFIRNLDCDVIRLPKSMPKTQGPTPRAPDALEGFLEWCATHRPARHYMLFLIGHGMIVGNDAFLPDDNPGTSISLKRLGMILGKFKDDTSGHAGELELVGMHSCSMSAIEVAYELKGTAKYMIASEGISFIGTWPYRQLLKKTFNSVKPGMNEDDIQLLLEKFYFHCLYNSTDFMFAGYASDLALCNLDATKVEETGEPIRVLVRALRQALKTECGQRHILQAHWRAQSYWQENYTDLYDFCRCLSEQCDEAKYTLCLHAKPDESCVEPGALKNIHGACIELMKKLDPPEVRGPRETLYGDADPDEGAGGTAAPREDEESSEVERRRAVFSKLVVFSEYFGPTYQYSHGLSIFFPWSRPVDPASEDVEITEEDTLAGGPGVLDKYLKYAFTEALGDDSWLSFLEDYFVQTKRSGREVELFPEGLPEGLRRAFVPGGVAMAGGGGGISVGAPDGALPGGGQGKSSPAEAGGAGCNCGSIKNYPKEFSMSLGALLRAKRKNGQ
jgi:hypothetical protein